MFGDGIGWTGWTGCHWMVGGFAAFAEAWRAFAILGAIVQLSASTLLQIQYWPGSAKRRNLIFVSNSCG